MPIISSGHGRQYGEKTTESIRISYEETYGDRTATAAPEVRMIKIIIELFKFWVVYPFRIIKHLVYKIFGKYNANRPGKQEYFSLVFLIPFAYFAINFYLNPNDLVALVLACAIFGITVLGEIIREAM